MKNGMRPIHPGEILREEFLTPLGVSANRFAKALGVPANRISAILAEKRAVTGDTALRLAQALKTTPGFWMNLQVAYDLRLAEKKSGREVVKIRPLRELTAA